MIEFKELSGKNFKIKYTLFGGHLTSYQTNGVEYLYLSPNAILDGTKPIRGGIPICWPWFGKSQQPAHGVARINQFSLVQEVVSDDVIEVELKLTYKDLEIVEKIVATATSLNVSISTKNNGAKTDFANGLHTYFKLDAENTKIYGLKGVNYEDTITKQTHTFQGEVFQIKKLVDFIIDPVAQLKVDDLINKKKFTINFYSNNKVIIWNPNTEAVNIPDLKEYKDFICIESCYLTEQIDTNETKVLGFQIDV